LHQLADVGQGGLRRRLTRGQQNRDKEKHALEENPMVTSVHEGY
jgi:hypothetical protein